MNTTTIDNACRRTDWSSGGDGDPPPASDPGSRLAERAAAQARYEAFVSDRAGDSPGCTPDPVARDAHSVVFVREGSDASEVDMADVQQGTLGDCYLMASLAGLARTPEGRALIRGAIVENKNDSGQVVSYTVTLHQPQTSRGSTTFTSIAVTVDGTSLGCGHARTRDASDGSFRETWPLVIEQAYAQTFGGYEAIGRGGTAAPALEALTGVAATHHTWLSFYGASALESDVASGKVVVFGTVDHPTQALVGHHAYVATATEWQNGRLMVTLHNPWGDSDDLTLPYDDVRGSLKFIDVGSAR